MFQLSTDNYLKNFKKDKDKPNLGHYRIEISDPKYVTDSVVLAIANDRDISQVILGTKYNPYTLTKSHYQMLKKGNKKKVITFNVDNDLIDVYDEMIDYNMKRPILGSNNYESLQSNFLLDLTYMNEEQIKNLKLIYQFHIISFDFSKMNPNLMWKIIIYLRENHFQNKIMIQYGDCKDKFLNFILSNVMLDCNFNYSFFENIFVANKFPKDIIDSENSLELKKINNDWKKRRNGVLLKDFLKYECRLYEMIEPAKNLSPFEKFLFAYNLVKQFKPYKENDKDKFSSRLLYEILDNDYIVCLGFTTLLNDLLTKLGIESTLYNVLVDIGLDNIRCDDFDPLSNDIITNNGPHSRLMVYLVDPKYNINGYYISDPTWDNDLNRDLYNHSLMTASEVVGLRRYNVISIKELENELLYCNSIEEFYEKINFIIKRIFENNTNINYINFVKKIIKIISKYDENFNKQIKERFNLLKSCDCYSISEINSIMDYVGNYIVSNDLEIDKLRKFVEEEKLNVEEIGSILKSDTLNKFFLRINYFLSRNKNTNTLYCEIFMKIFELIKLIDKDLSIKIEEKFGNISISNRVYSKEEVQNILTYIGENIVAKSNNIVSGEKYKEAITVLYRDVYKYPDFEERVNLTMKTNKNFQELVFPKFIKEDKDGIRTVVYNDVNKFDLESETSKSL